MIRATSRNNPKLREAARLVASGRDRRKADKCVLEGEHLVGVYAERIGAPDTVVLAEPFLDRPSVRALVARFDDRVVVVPERLFDELAALPAGVGMLAVVATPRPAAAVAGDFCLLLEDVQDPGNVGSMLRSAAAAGVGDACLSRHCAFAWSPKVLRAGMGAHFQLAIHEDVDLVAWSRTYRDRGASVLGMVGAGGVDLYRTRLAQPLAIAIGNEGAGLSSSMRKAASATVTIPMPGGVESLNAAAAAAVVLFECVRRFSGK